MYFTSQKIVPIWNQDMRIIIALDSSCYTLLAVLLLTIWILASYNTKSVSYNWAVSRIFAKSIRCNFPMVSTSTLNSASKCFVKLICLLGIPYFLYLSVQESYGKKVFAQVFVDEGTLPSMQPSHLAKEVPNLIKTCHSVF